ncbi:restriction endonuclease [Clostridium butyricum]|uniref:restriction endonuclease n=1 Tax=Clostridium butyricum TaxID=1492 RepID=UPI00189CE5FE|nr:restriction endonuclease [Clostridium butyricum]MDB2153822.1 restriction endonuclease [Clostridium butyricum]
MSLIDFKEIPCANVSNGNQDTFELFARDFFETLGFKIIENPDRGQDGGRDLIIEEQRTGYLDTTNIRWLVSCKHKIFSGNSVLDKDEINILDRVTSHNCNGFIGFYSTLPSSGLNKTLINLKDNRKIELQIFDCKKIEQILCSSDKYLKLIQRYFPKSFKQLNPKSPSNLLSEYMPLKCSHCGKDLLQLDSLDDYSGIIVFLEKTNHDLQKTKIENIYYSCKGRCDDIQQNFSYKLGFFNSWEDISDLVIPQKYISWIMSILNGMYSGELEFSDTAFDKLKDFIIAISQIVLKNQTNSDLSRLQTLSTVPDWA